MPAFVLLAALASFPVSSNPAAAQDAWPRTGFEFSLALDVVCPAGELRKRSTAVINVRRGPAPGDSAVVIAPVNPGSHEDSIAAHLADELNDEIEYEAARVVEVPSGPDRLVIETDALAAELHSPQADACHHVRLSVEVDAKDASKTLKGVVVAPTADPGGESVFSLAVHESGADGPTLTTLGLLLPPRKREATFAALAEELTLRGWPAESTKDGVRVLAREGRTLERLTASIEPADRDSSRGTAPGLKIALID